MLSLALTSGWYYICTSYCTPNKSLLSSTLTMIESGGGIELLEQQLN